jgi:hypothetical protein
MADFTYHPTAFGGVETKTIVWGVVIVGIILLVCWWLSKGKEGMTYEGTVGPLKEKSTWGISSTLLGDRTGYPGLYTTGRTWGGR